VDFSMIAKSLSRMTKVDREDQTVSDSVDSTSECLISVIVATFNAGPLLQSCISSFAEQDLARKELIVVDGGSTDETVELLSRNSKHVNHWITEPDQGICDAWNKGVKMASGKWILFLGADDYLVCPTVLTDVALCLEVLPESCRVAYGKIFTVSKRGDMLAQWGRPWIDIKDTFRSMMVIPHQGVFHRKSLFDEVGGFDIFLRFAGDYDLLLRAIELSPPQFMDGTVVTAMGVGGVSSRPTLSASVLQEFRIARRNRGWPAVTLPWLWAYIKARVKGVIAKALGDDATVDLIRRVKGVSGDSRH
jgi:glycosyltransferase involved in cell wall biosynthesis